MPSKPNDPRERLFEQALDLPEAQREPFLRSQCAENPRLADEILELLRLNDDNSDGLLEAQTPDVLAEQVPTRIGKYRVHRLIGSGGMSSVFEGEHAGTGARAAIKLIRVGLATSRQRVRFQLEAELLARLNHPGIAHLLDAGEAQAEYADGTHAPRLFIAMEFVDGQTIRRHCESAALSLRDRVRLMSKVAHAVQYAHAQGVIHRDLKPANILVRTDHEPKVVDFGIARLVSSPRSVTASGVILGTPNYMSPEQMAGRHDEVSAASDVYALGAVLYELLAGKPPIEAPSSLSPSAAFSMLHAVPDRLRVLRSEVPRDLDAIIHKALERSAAKRYPTAMELADDLDRWLSSRPVEARQPSIIDRARLQFRRRPKSTVAALVATTSVLTLGSLAGWQAYRATKAERQALHRLELITEEKNRADEQTRIAIAVQNFLTKDIIALAGTTKQADLGMLSNPDITLREVLDRAAARVGDGRFKDQPEVEAAVRSVIANAYIDIDKPKSAISQLERAVDLYTASIGPDKRATLDVRASLASATHGMGKSSAAVDLFEPLLQDALKHLGPNHSLTIIISNNYALALNGVGRKADAIKLVTDALERANKTLGEGDVESLRLRNTLLLARSGTPKAPTEADLIDMADITAKALGKHHPDALNAQYALGLHYCKNDKYDRATPILLAVTEGYRDRLGPEHPKTLAAMHTLGANLSLSGDLEGGLKYLREGYDINLRVRGPNHEDTLLDGSNIAETLRRLKRPEEALVQIVPIVERMKQALGENHSTYLAACSTHGHILLDLKKPAEAEQVLKDGMARTIALGSSGKSLVKKYRRVLALCMDAMNRPDEAAEYRK